MPAGFIQPSARRVPYPAKKRGFESRLTGVLAAV